MTPKLGLCPKTPQNADGSRIDPPDVRTDLKRRQSGGHRGGGAAGRSPRDASAVPGIDRRPEHLVVRLAVRRPARHVRLAKDDRARLAQRPDDGGIALGDIPLQLDRPARRPQTGRLDRVLDRHGQAVQRAQVVAPRDGGVCSPRRRPCALKILGHDRVQGRINPLRPLCVALEQIRAAQLPGADRGGLTRRRPKGWVVRHEFPHPTDCIASRAPYLRVERGTRGEVGAPEPHPLTPSPLRGEGGPEGSPSAPRSR